MSPQVLYHYTSEVRVLSTEIELSKHSEYAHFDKLGFSTHFLFSTHF